VAVLTLKDIMAPTVFRVDTDTTIRDAARIMRSKDLGSLLITRGHDPVGIVTETDMVRRVLARDLNPDTHTVEEIMSAPLITVEAATGILEARDRMDQERVRHLLVTENGEIRGIVSVRDLIHKPRLARPGQPD
jgi:signal-transduction protein with cAMP-binding, CBS, and nucleotidyltransferase domain